VILNKYLRKKEKIFVDFNNNIRYVKIQLFSTIFTKISYQKLFLCSIDKLLQGKYLLDSFLYKTQIYILQAGFDENKHARIISETHKQQDAKSGQQKQRKINPKQHALPITICDTKKQFPITGNNWQFNALTVNLCSKNPSKNPINSYSGIYNTIHITLDIRII